MRLHPLILAATVLATGCASSPKPNFQAIYPGMHTRQVVEAMHSGPSRAQEFGDGSSAWYYGEDRCLLIRDEKVVSKQQTQESTSVEAVVVSIKNSTKALCAPAGTAEATSEQEISTPLGNFKGSIDTEAIKKKAQQARDEVLGKSTE